jgi:acetyl esterase/lipase
MDFSNPLPIIKALVPKVPMMGKVTLMHTIGATETSKYWDLKTELIINVIRSFVHAPKPSPISRSQKMSTKNTPIKGKIWIANADIPAPQEDDFVQAVLQAIKEADGRSGVYAGEPKAAAITAEWTGWRKDAKPDEPLPEISEAEKYEKLMAETESPTTVLYFHGGAYYLMDPASHRISNSKLAKLTKGRVFSVRYRLAPQSAFPHQLIDALLSYLTLLYPPTGSLHTAVDPKHIVFGGDSAGGNLATALTLLILQLNRSNRKITFNGVERDIPLPAGVYLNSPWMDITHSMPSCETNGKWDYLPSADSHPNGISYPDEDGIWPTTPPRRTLYAEDAALTHPFVSPLAAPVDLWRGAPPVWMCTGWELLADEDKVTAQRMAAAGVTIQFNEFEAMPHCFGLMFDGAPGAKACLNGVTKFMREVTSNPSTVKSYAKTFKAKTLKEVDLDLGGLSPYTYEQCLERMNARISKLTAEHPDTLARL